MRRFEVYFLQKKTDGVWETLERAQSVSVLVASLVTEFDAREDAEVRILAGAYDEAAGDWEFTQIFFVDRSAIEVALAEREDDEDWVEAPPAAAMAHDRGEPEPMSEPDEDTEAVPGGQAFADAIRRASDDEDGGAAPEDEGWNIRTKPRPIEDVLDEVRPVGPPPRFAPERRRSAKLFFVVGTVIIATILTAAAVLALGIALDAPQVRPVLSVFKELTSGFGGAETHTPTTAKAVMPETTGQVVTYKGVAPGLRGRWSPGKCDETYIEFDEDGLVVGSPGRPESLKVPVTETLEDDYTWYVRRSPDLVEHFQKLGPNDLQLVGDTTRVGFAARTSDILTRCP